MCGGPSNVTATTTQSPPSYLQGPLQGLTQMITQQAGLGGFDPMGGFAGKDRKRFAKLQRLRDKGKKFGKQERLENMLGLSPGGQPNFFPNNPNLGGGLQGGGALADITGHEGTGFDPMPFLTDSFNRAADLTRTRLSSEFAGAGRNIGASLPARSDELQTLASNFFDPNNLFRFDPTNVLIDRLSGIIPNAGGVTRSSQPIFRTGLF